MRKELCSKNEYLRKGLKTISVKIAENSRDLVRSLEGQKSQEVDWELLNSQKMQLTEYLSTYASLSYGYLLKEYMDAYILFLKNYALRATLSNFLFGLFVLVMGVVVYSSYVNQLGERIWKTKSMLNMIPLKVLESNEDLRKRILESGVFKAIQ